MLPPLARYRPRDEVFYVTRDRTALATARDGFLHGAGGQGLFVLQTRIVSIYRYWIDGKAPEPSGISNLEEHSQIAYYVAPREPDAIELRLSRTVGDGMRETVELTNHTADAVHLVLELELDGDFADPSETSTERKQRGATERSWRTDGPDGELVWIYTASHDYDHQGHRGRASLCRTAHVRISGPEPPTYDEARRRIRWELGLEPRGRWHGSVSVWMETNGQTFALHEEHRAERDEFLRNSSRIGIASAPLAHAVSRALGQARRDLIALRLYDLDAGGGWTMSAGLPTYLALFGRDTLTASWQAALIGPEMMRGTLSQLAESQAGETDDWRDCQPGKFIHQADKGPLATLMYNPLGSYYGDLTVPSFYPVALSTLWHWTGDREAVRRLLGPAMKGLAWLDSDSKRGHFYTYETRSEQGLKNQCWKDSGDGIVYPDGSAPPDPIAPCEAQAYVFASKVRMSELLWWLAKDDAERRESRRLFDEAMELRDRFNEAYWMEDEGCFGMGLDADGVLIRSVGSESAHAVAAGIVHHDRAARTIERLFQPDLFSGWGLRTLSSQHKRFDPFSYHRGSVWPAEQAAFCMGLMRYGSHQRLHQLTKALFEAASLFEYERLPELFAGHQRDEQHPIPGLYRRANSPQAWSASAAPCMIQALLGIFPYAPLRLLFVDPHLPEWLPVLRLENVRVGGAAADLEFRRGESGRTDYRVLDLRGELRIIRQPSPWSLTTSFGERLIDAISSLAAG